MRSAGRRGHGGQGGGGACSTGRYKIGRVADGSDAGYTRTICTGLNSYTLYLDPGRGRS